MTAAAPPDQVADLLRLALRRLPGPVSLVTTCEPDTKQPAGMVASAVIPVSMEPPSMLVSVNRSSRMHGVMTRSGRFCINLLGTEQTEYVGLFSTPQRRGDRFASQHWRYEDGIPYLPTGLTNIFCELCQSHEFGTHELFIGRVIDVRGDPDAEGDPLGWMEGDFARFGRLD